MKNTWASGAIELLKHGEEHLKLDTSFDRKMAFISIDNCVELTIKSYLSLPKRYFGETHPTRSELDNAYNSFPSLLDLIDKYAHEKLEGIELIDIEHYHRIRNTLYHQGTGLSVNEEYLELYYSMARILLLNLFDIKIDQTSKTEKSLYSEILIGWSQIEHLINDILKQRSIESKNQSKWKIFQEMNLVDKATLILINKIRNERNRIAHSNSFDIKPDKYLLPDIEKVKNTLKESFNSFSQKHNSDFSFYPLESELSGELIVRSFFGPPNYGEDPINDAREDAYILKLKYPINVISNKTIFEEGDSDITELNVNEVQLVPNKSLKGYVNKIVKVKGVFFGANTGHHRTPVLLDLKEIEEFKS